MTAAIVKIRGSAFIGGLQWLPAITDPDTGLIHEYAGDAREFTPHAVNTDRSRVEQEVVVDFVKRKLFTFANTGSTTLRVTKPGGISEFKRGKASADGVIVSNETWDASSVSFVMSATAANPLRPTDPAVDYELYVTVHEETGQVEVKGRHDGFPCFEFYKQVDFGDFELLYRHDFRVMGDTPAAMAGDMEYHFERMLTSAES
ncbi:DUF3238 domain-containing protein [Paenibacillus sp. CF384]|uniref:DUF3238 domain-containing protein n=1 Tax=Paenibacillus sp. CF384 TaxID=1884382 RepID=UPI00089C6228|nr:DUF3238 domain-containing protein [Paenibacillus sp. CF384]SDX32744.1 Protein of unknown function [Paenibacillus sp. CF384]